MTRATTRSHFHSSSLIRVLTDLAMVDTSESSAAFAKKLGLWLSLADDINLCAVHNASVAAVVPQATAVVDVDIRGEFTRIRSRLVASITQSSSSGGGKPPLPLTAPQFDTPTEVAAAYGPYRRYYLEQQREMDLSIRPLQVKTRNVLANASPALRQLAALDATFDEILGCRTSKLFATIPSLLSRRFDQLHKARQHQLIETQQKASPAVEMPAGGWLAQFSHDLQIVLLAELDVRLLPTVGLIEALNNELTRHS